MTSTTKCTTIDSDKNIILYFMLADTFIIVLHSVLVNRNIRKENYFEQIIQNYRFRLVGKDRTVEKKTDSKVA